MLSKNIAIVPLYVLLVLISETGFSQSITPQPAGTRAMQNYQFIRDLTAIVWKHTRSTAAARQHSRYTAYVYRVSGTLVQRGCRLKLLANSRLRYFRLSGQPSIQYFRDKATI